MEGRFILDALKVIQNQLHEVYATTIRMGMTTAEAVPPRTQPIVRLMMGSTFKPNQTTNHTTMAETTKFNAVNLSEGLKESFKLLKLS